MKPKIQKTCDTAPRWAIVLFALAAVTISGAEAASRLFSAGAYSKKTILSAAGQAEISVDPTDISAASEKMDPTSRPDTEPVGIIKSPAVIKSNTSGSRGHNHFAGSLGNLSGYGGSSRAITVASSLCLVSSSLGRQLTLVGAKPSGTG
ncbi:MAG: hypothetical protein JSU65_14585 [Candidatus Zixiibacteriota bacterium]|nr:MAG: hypothetical protein JSU65_14585 [candidate division Zixibacteria bacterium]